MTAPRDHTLEDGLLSSDEKQALYSSELPPASPPTAERRRKRVSKPLLVAMILGALVTVSITLGPRIAPCMRHQAAGVQNPPEVTLSQPLSDHVPFKQGAEEAVHKDEPAVATSIVRLERRQADSNSTEESPDKPTEEPPTEKPTEEPTEEPPTEEPPTDKPTEEPTKEPTKGPEPTVNPPEKTTTTADKPPVETKDSSSSRPTPTPTPTPTGDDDDDQATSTSSSSRSRIQTTSRTTLTSTRPDGVVTTITSTSYYDVEPLPTGDESNEDDPDLQDAAPKMGAALVPALIAAAGAFLVI